MGAGKSKVSAESEQSTRDLELAPKEALPEDEKETDKAAGAEKGPSSDPNEALRYHVTHGDEEKIRELTQRGADVNCPDLGEHEDEVAKAKLEEIAKAKEAAKEEEEEEEEKPRWVRPKSCRPITGDYPLHLAAQYNFPKVISQLYYLNALTENKDRVGSTALHRAVSMGNVDSVLELIKLGANVHALNKIGMTPLHIAVAAGDLPMIKLLLKHGAVEDLETQNRVQMTPIEYSTRGSPERGFLLEHYPKLAKYITDESPEAEIKSDPDDIAPGPAAAPVKGAPSPAIGAIVGGAAEVDVPTLGSHVSKSLLNESPNHTTSSDT